MEQSEKRIESMVQNLYVAHFLASWGDRMWEFALALLFLEIWADSLFLVALYGLVQSGTVAIWGMQVGHWVDNFSRRTVVTLAIVIQNSAITLSSIIILILLAPHCCSEGFWMNHELKQPGLQFDLTPSDILLSRLLHSSSPTSNQSSSLVYNGTELGIWGREMQEGRGWMFPILVLIIISVAGVGSLADLAMNVAVERDWVVVVAAESSQAGKLAQVNAGMKQIDLFCKLMAPSVVGFMMGAINSFNTAVAIILWNVATAFVEYGLLISAYKALPALAVKNPGNASSSSFHGGESVDPEGSLGEERRGNGAAVAVGSAAAFLRQKAVQISEGWRVYLRQDTLLPSISLAFLYLTVLSFGALMTADLSWEGVPAGVLGTVRGASALTGIVGTVIYPLLERRISIQQTGVWAIWSQWAFLVLCAVGVFFHGWTSSALLMAGVIFSRVGLWMFDLTVVQLVQMSVPEAERGVVGGVQGSLQQFFFMLVYVAALLVPRPGDFWVLVLISFGMVTLAAILFTVYAVRHRDERRGRETPLLS